MHPVQNTRQKSIARKTMILIAAITLGTVVATNALAAGHGGGSGGHGGGGGFGGGHVGGGFVGGRMAGDHLEGHAGAFPNSGGADFHGTRMGGGFHDRNHHFREHGGVGLYGYVPGYGDYGYDDYGYDDLGGYADDSACFQYRQVYTIGGWQWRQVWVCN